MPAPPPTRARTPSSCATRIGALEAALAVAEGRIQTGEAALAAAETRLRVETVARTTLEDELDRERAARAEAGELRAALEAERDARRAAEEALAAARAEAERTGTTLQERIAELERRAAAAPDLERVAREHASEREPAADAVRVVADLDAAADALRRRGTPAAEVEASPAAEDESEPPAPDAEPGIEWGGPGEPQREPCVPAVEPARPKADPDEPPPWMPPGFETSGPGEAGEPPAPDAEPAVESAPPEEPPAPEQQAPPAEPSAAPSPTTSPLAELSLVPAPPVVPAPPPETKPSGPIIVSAPGPPSRALATGSERRDYPLLRGAIVKLAHDDPATAAALLVALLPGQGAAIEGPLGYDLTIREAGTFARGDRRRPGVGRADRDPAPARHRRVPPDRRRHRPVRAAGGRRAPHRALLRPCPRAGPQAAREGAASPGREHRHRRPRPPAPARAWIPASCTGCSPTRSIRPGRAGTTSRSPRRSPARRWRPGT